MEKSNVTPLKPKDKNTKPGIEVVNLVWIYKL